MKKKIFTITPNPALDLSGFVKDLKPNEKSYVYNAVRSPGGNSINSARILSRLKATVVLSGFLGGSTGDEINFLMKKENLNTEFIQIKRPSRINVTVGNELNHNQTRLSFPGPKVSASEKSKLFRLYEAQKNISFLLLGGSLPNGFTSKDIVYLLKISHRKNIKAVVDCPGEILRAVIQAKPFLIKPNLEEFQEFTGSHVKSIGSVIEKAKRYLNDVQYICVSSVEGGTLLVGQKNIYFGKVPNIKIKSTVGAGDSLVGAMVYELNKNYVDESQVLKRGLAAAAATLFEPGMNLGSRNEISKMYQKVKIQKIE
tara:strand:+ start:1429 stop:2367 length:939 start_codon:yes stop_codon:yes gene_type:complete